MKVKIVFVWFHNFVVWMRKNQKAARSACGGGLHDNLNYDFIHVHFSSIKVSFVQPFGFGIQFRRGREFDCLAGVLACISASSIISWPYCRALDQMELTESHECGLLNSPSKHFAAFCRLKLIYGVPLRHRSPQLRNDVLMDIFCCLLETVNCTLKDNCECNKISRRLTQITDRSIALLLTLPKHIALRILEIALILLFVESSCPLRSSKSDHELETLGNPSRGVSSLFCLWLSWVLRRQGNDLSLATYLHHTSQSTSLCAFYGENCERIWLSHDEMRWCHDVAAHRWPNESQNFNCTMTSMGFHLKRITLRTQRDNKAVPAQEFPINRWFIWVRFVCDVRGA